MVAKKREVRLCTIDGGRWRIDSLIVAINVYDESRMCVFFFFRRIQLHLVPKVKSYAWKIATAYNVKRFVDGVVRLGDSFVVL